MEPKILRALVVLGVPGVALGIFYLLFRNFGWTFPIVPSEWVGPIIILFLLLVGGVTFYALTLWRPMPVVTPGKTINSISISIPAKSTFEAAVRALARNDKRSVDFKGFTKKELGAALDHQDISADTVAQAILQLRALSKGVVRSYRVEIAASGGYLIIAE